MRTSAGVFSVAIATAGLTIGAIIPAQAQTLPVAQPSAATAPQVQFQAQTQAAQPAPAATAGRAPSNDPYISAIDDRPAARLRREQQEEAAKSGGMTQKIPPELLGITRAAEPRADFEPEMVVINPATFQIGSPKEEVRRSSNEGPRVLVNTRYAFEIGRYEVTFDEWDRCLADGGCNGFVPDDKGWGRGKNPVTNISYNDALSYIDWLNAKSGKIYRLPSEAEWEYVARAGSNNPFSTVSGVSITAADANFNGEFPYGPDQTKGEYIRKPVTVGSYAPNYFGLYDIHGNVYEFTSDCFVKGHVGNPADGSPRTDGNCDRRVIRGGSWVTHGYQMRAAKRISYTKDYRYDDFGFRLARTLNTPAAAPARPAGLPPKSAYGDPTIQLKN